MEEGFQSRLAQVFGGLGNGAAPWSVSGTQLERQRWLPTEASEDEEEGPPCSSGFRSDEQQEGKRHHVGNGEYDDEEEQVGAMVGMDTTLDFEEEEDEYDKVAVGREGAGDRLYTSDVKASFDSLNFLPTMSRDFQNFRASDRASYIRVAEAEAAMNGGTVRDSDRSSSGSRSKGGGAQTDSRAKRKNESGESHRPQKKVRFAVEENKKRDDSRSDGDHHRRRAGDDRYRNVPHHVRHPEKYTHYTLDWSEEGSSNVQAWQSTMAAVGSSKKEEEEERFELPDRVAFVPRGSKDRAATKPGGSSRESTTPVASMSFAERDGVEDESAGATMTSSKGQRSRSYRSRTTEE